MEKYRAFGLTIESQVPLPELLPANEYDPPDVTIRIGDVPNALHDAITGRGVLYQINAREFRLEIAGIGSYYASNGTTILVQPAAEADAESIRLFLLGSTIGALLHQRGLLPIHASSIVTPRGAVLFTGQSGAGKSTITAAFRQRGYNILADDVSVIALSEDGIPMAMPGYPQLKLWANTLEDLNESTHTYARVRPAIEKYAVPVAEAFTATAVPIYAMYIISESEDDQLVLEPVSGLEKLPTIFNNLYRRRYQEQMGLMEGNLPLSIATSKHVRFMRLKRAKDAYQFREIIDLLEKDFLDG